MSELCFVCDVHFDNIKLHKIACYCLYDVCPTVQIKKCSHKVAVGTLHDIMERAHLEV